MVGKACASLECENGKYVVEVDGMNDLRCMVFVTVDEQRESTDWHPVNCVPCWQTRSDCTHN